MISGLMTTLTTDSLGVETMQFNSKNTTTMSQ